MKFFQTVMIVSAMSSRIVSAMSSSMAGGTDIDVSLASGGYHTCALLEDKTVQCWGDNDKKQLGVDNLQGSSSAIPQQVQDLANVKAISAGKEHTCALLEDKTVKCWGKNDVEQLGVDTGKENRATPYMLGGLADVKAISAGEYHTCALLEDKTVKCWGENTYLQLGVDTLPDSAISTATPQQVQDLSNVKAISAGEAHTCALLEDKTVKCWGRNHQKQLGEDSYSPHAIPQQVPDLDDVKAIYAGEAHTCALLGDETVKCWGYNSNKQLGVDTSATSTATPQQVQHLYNVKAISAGEYHTCALLGDKTVKCWGGNFYKKLGVDTNANSATPTPQQVQHLSNVKTISAGLQHTCALLEDDTVKCWGGNQEKQLGVDTLGEDAGGNVVTATATPQEVFGLTISGPDYDDLMLDNYETPYEKARDDYFYWLAELEKVAPPYKSSRDAFVRGTLIYVEKDIGHEGKFTKLPKRQSDLQQERLARLNQKINSFAGHRRLAAGYHYDQRAKHEQTQMGYRKVVADEKDKHAKHFSGTFEQNHPLYKAYTFYKRMTARYLSVTDQVRKAANIYDARREAFMSMTDALSSNIASGDFDIGDLMTVSTDDVRELIKEEGVKPLSKLWHDRRLSNSVSKESLTKLQMLQGSYWQSQSSEEKFNIVEQIQKILKQQGKKRLRSSRPREFCKSDEFIPVSTARLLKRSRHVLVEKLSRKKSGELVILQHLYWKTKNSEVKYKTAQSIEQLILK